MTPDDFTTTTGPHDETVYTLRGGVVLLDEHAGVLIDSAGNFVARTRGNPRSLAAVMRMIADEIEENDR